VQNAIPRLTSALVVLNRSLSRQRTGIARRQGRSWTTYWII